MAPHLGIAHPSQPLWHRADIYLHFWLSLGTTAWIAAGLQRFKQGWKYYLRWCSLPAGILIALSDETLQPILGRGRSWDITDFYGDLAGIGVVAICLLINLPLNTASFRTGDL